MITIKYAGDFEPRLVRGGNVVSGVAFTGRICATEGLFVRGYGRNSRCFIVLLTPQDSGYLQHMWEWDPKCNLGPTIADFQKVDLKIIATRKDT